MKQATGTVLLSYKPIARYISAILSVVINEVCRECNAEGTVAFHIAPGATIPQERCRLDPVFTLTVQFLSNARSHAPRETQFKLTSVLDVRKITSTPCTRLYNYSRSICRNAIPIHTPASGYAAVTWSHTKLYGAFPNSDFLLHVML
jgi:hypothetical protein